MGWEFAGLKRTKKQGLDRVSQHGKEYAFVNRVSNNRDQQEEHEEHDVEYEYDDGDPVYPIGIVGKVM